MLYSYIAKLILSVNMELPQQANSLDAPGNTATCCSCPNKHHVHLDTVLVCQPGYAAGTEVQALHACNRNTPLRLPISCKVLQALEVLTMLSVKLHSVTAATATLCLILQDLASRNPTMLRFGFVADHDQYRLKQRCARLRWPNVR